MSAAPQNSVVKNSAPLGSAAAATGRWSIMWLLFAASMINYLDRTTISFALPEISASLGLTASSKGLLLSAFFWSYAFMQVPMGVLADRFNLRWFYAGAFTLWSVAQGFTGLANTLFVFFCFRVVLGIGEAIYLPGGNKIVGIFFASSERGLPCGFFDSGTRAGMFLGGLLVPLLLRFVGWRWTFAIIGFSALLWLVPWLKLTPKDMRATHEPSMPVLDARPPSPITFRHWKDLTGICIGFFCFDYYWYLLVNWLPDYLVNVRHLSGTAAGIYSAIGYLVFAFCQPLGGWAGDRLIRAGWNETWCRKGIVSVAFLSGLLLIPAVLAANWGVAEALIVGSCLVGLSTANQLVILQSCAPPDRVGLFTGIYNFVGNLAGIPAAWLTGVLIERTHSYTPAFMLAAFVVVAGQLSYWFLVGRLQPQAASK